MPSQASLVTLSPRTRKHFTLTPFIRASTSAIAASSVQSADTSYSPFASKHFTYNVMVLSRCGVAMSKSSSAGRAGLTWCVLVGLVAEQGGGGLPAW